VPVVVVIIIILIIIQPAQGGEAGGPFNALSDRPKTLLGSP
jgi:preprotein translocase subunit SecG